MKALLKPYEEQLHSVVKEIIGVAKESLLVAECGGQECAIGDIYADAVLNAVSTFKYEV